MRADSEPCPACGSEFVCVVHKRKVELSPVVCLWFVAVLLPGIGSQVAGGWGVAVTLPFALLFFVVGALYLFIEAFQFMLHCQECDLKWFAFPWQLPKADSY